MDKERIDKQIQFCLEIDKEKQIGRQTFITGASRKENDAEHAWHMAIMTLILQEYANEDIDVLKTISMLLIHDLVEVYAGDTFAYDEEGKKTQKAREDAAADKLYGLLPEDQGKKLRELWDEFEEWSTQEAKFAHTMDNFQPVMLNDATDGRLWKENQVHISQILKRNEKTKEGSRDLWDYEWEHFIEPHVESGDIKK